MAAATSTAAAMSGQHMYLKALRGSAFAGFMPGHVYAAPPLPSSAATGTTSATGRSKDVTAITGSAYGLKRNLPAKTTLKRSSLTTHPEASEESVVAVPVKIGALDATERFTDLEPAEATLARAAKMTYLTTRCLRRPDANANGQTRSRNVPTLSRDEFQDLLKDTASSYAARPASEQIRTMDPYATPDSASFQTKLGIARHERPQPRHAHLDYTRYKPIQTRVTGRFLSDCGRQQQTVGVSGVTGVLRAQNERMYAPGALREEPQMFYVSGLHPNTVHSPVHPQYSAQQAAIMNDPAPSLLTTQSSMEDGDAHHILHFTQQNPASMGVPMTYGARGFSSRFGADRTVALPNSYHAATSHKRQYMMQQQEQRRAAANSSSSSSSSSSFSKSEPALAAALHAATASKPASSGGASHATPSWDMPMPSYHRRPNGMVVPTVRSRPGPLPFYTHLQRKQAAQLEKKMHNDDPLTSSSPSSE